MQFMKGDVYHVYNQGNNQQTLFHTDEDYLVFLQLIKRLLITQSEILAWCLMPNHFHFMVYATEKSGQKIQQGGIEIEQLANGIRKLLSGYARIYNQKYTRSGSLFRQKTKSKNLVEEAGFANANLSDYLFNYFNYIHENPVAAGLVESPAEWTFSSYADYAGKRNGSLCNKKLAAEICGFSSLDFR